MLKRSQIDPNNYLIKQLPKATAFLNKKLEVVYASDLWIKDFEFTNGKVIGEKISALIKHISKDLQKDFKDCLKGNVGSGIKECYKEKDNPKTCTEWTNIPWYDEKENIIGVIVQTECITEKLNNKSNIERLQLLLQEKSTNANIGSWQYDAELNSLWWCHKTRQIHEVDANFIPKIETCFDFYKEGHSKNTISMAFFEASEKGLPWKEKLQIVTEKGNEKWIMTTGKPIYKDDKFMGLVGTFQDINEQVITNKKTKENELLLRTLIDNLPVNIYVKDMNLRKILVNKAECEYNGVDSPEELLGKTDFDFLSKKSAKLATYEEYEVINTLKPILSREGICTSKDGTETNFLSSKIPLINEDNEVGGIIGMSLDITEKRNAEKKLEEKDRYFRSIFNSSYQFTGILDIDGTLIEINDTALDFANLKVEDIVGKKFWDAYWWPVPDFVKDGLKQMVKAAAKGKFMRSEIKVLDQNKNQVPVDFTLKPIYNDNNKVVSLLAEGRMITEMVAAREKLKESELKFRTLYEMSPVSFILYDFETGKILDFNPSFESISGYDKKSIEKINFWDFLHNKNQQYREQVKNELENKGIFGPFEEKLINKDGIEYSVIINKSLIVNKNGEKFVWTIIQDISESEKKERQIREERKLLKTLIDNLPLNVYIKDTQSIKILVNQAECDYLGVDSAEELLGKSDFDLYDKEVAQISRDEDLKVMNTMEPILSRETTNIKKDGTITTFLTSKIPLKAANGKITGLVGISLDISDIKKKEEELKNLIDVTSLQNKKLVNFAHIVSHNLRSHTANFSMLLEFLVSEKDEEEKQNLVNMLVKASDHLLETLNNLNEVVVINTNINRKKKNIFLNKEIKSVEKNLSVLFKNKNAKIINTIEDDVKINAIPAYLDSILMNLFTNAIMYKSPDRNPIITLSSSRENGYTILSINDNGLGIDLKKHGDKLFGMYKTFHDNADSKGIGLFLSKNQMEAMGGKIITASEVGKGTTFNLHFNEDN